jgi:hypothetical protein
MFSDPLTQQLATFVRGIGIDVKAAVLQEPTFVPGLDIQYGAILVDQPRLTYPGDILHEAGHIAVAAPQSRKEPRLSPDGGDEMAALAWSYAAARHLKLDPSVVFHSGGYKGGSPALIENFAAGNYLGVPLLQFYGMTVESRSAAARGAKPYPHMLCWLRCNA